MHKSLLAAIVAALLTISLVSVVECRKSRTVAARKRVLREENAALTMIHRSSAANDSKSSNRARPNVDSEQCRCGAPQNVLQGPPGRDGIPGQPGYPGLPGPSTICPKEKESITPGLTHVRQCAWNKHNMQISTGQVQTCSFNKRNIETALRVEWHGVTRLRCLPHNTSCCARWHFTFNGGECVNPQPIDGLVYVDHHYTVHRSMNVIGVCRGLETGVNDIGFVVGECGGEYPLGEVKTGWNSSSRIIIQEVVMYN